MTGEISKQRTRNYLVQLKGSFAFKLLAILASFLLIPIMIKYLGNEQYGIWSTLLSIASWIVLFDLGIGNGLRNKISEALAQDRALDAQKYISTSYVLIGGISSLLIVLFLLISSFIPWQEVFNTKVLSNREINDVVDITVGFLILNFFLSLINQVANGIQKTSIVVFNQFLSATLSLILIWLLSIYTTTTLVGLAFLYGLSLALSNIIITIWVYGRQKALTPKLSLYHTEFIHPIISLGAKFFVIQIAVVVIFTTDKILITQLFGPGYVTQYDVVFKLFSIIAIAHGILMAPLWSSYADAYHRGDIDWIKVMMQRQLKIMFVFFGLTILLMFTSLQVITLWIGSDFNVDTMLINMMALFIIVSTWNNVFAFFLNAINEVKIQMYTSVLALIINIPLSIFIVRYFDTGVSGIIIGTVISLLFFAIAGPIQTFSLLKREKNNE